ncbi:hypothetical protein MKW98_019919 [Papaver atlanticum]|uniref:Uncharacterized protein n=1 Tax=Papaver atlanticum TaxID=357466 RepID=A0AAD4S1Y5_9MAGN|nr:hypothetical protein MKW98_019919 [Papaver atlanticum]
MWAMGDSWAMLGTSVGSLLFIIIPMIIEYLFPHGFLHKLREQYITPHINRFTKLYVQISIDEYPDDQLIDQKNQAYTFTEAYLSALGMDSAMQLKAYNPKNSSKLILNMVDYELSIRDEFHGSTFWWMLTSAKEFGKPRKDDRDNPQRAFTLTFLKKDRLLVRNKYLNHVMEKGKEIFVQNQHRKLYTNNPKERWYKETTWSHVVFNHPSAFDNLAMDAAKKADIMEDLIAFSKAKDYYAKIGKAWNIFYTVRRFMSYDIYDLELKSLKGGNSELRKLLLDTSDKSIIVIEDIDCNIALTDKRLTEKKVKSKKEKTYAEMIAEARGDRDITLSGLLNFIDGLWSSTGGERLIIFTTNHVEKLDPALIRRGRMDKHIEMGYCCFDGFKVLAKNYLNIDDHPSFETIRRLIDETITPADVAENLMPKTVSGVDCSEVCLGNLISALEQSKEDAARLAAEKQSEDEEESKEDIAEQNNKSEEDI